METVVRDRFEYERCPVCGGSFFDFGEMLEEARSDTEPNLGYEKNVYRGDDAPDHPEPERRVCPRDGTPMNEKEYSYDS